MGVATNTSSDRTEQGATPRVRLDSALQIGFWLECIPVPAIVIGEELCIVAANRAFEGLCPPELGDPTGRRIGAALGCAHCLEGDGCGQTRFCPACGALSAVTRGMAHGARVRDMCRLMRMREDRLESFELEVTATHFEMDAESFEVVAFRDISLAALVALLERVFIHDLRNVAAGALGYAEFLEEELGAGSPLYSDVHTLHGAVAGLMDTIEAHRQLVDAERGRLALEKREVDTAVLMETVRRTYARHSAAVGREIAMEPGATAVIATDPNVLGRALGNLLVNALEASSPGEVVTLSCAEADGGVRFDVHNSAVIPAEDQLRIFHRTFTTKGMPGRGVGTHAVKLFTERYLGGRVSFESARDVGTTFSVFLPRGMG
jgi:signal transduction histidine kinase